MGTDVASVQELYEESLKRCPCIDLDVKVFIKFLRGVKNLSDGSIRTNLKRLHNFRKVDYQLPLTVFDLEELSQALGSIRSHLKSNNTRNNLRTALRHWFDFLHRSMKFDMKQREQLKALNETFSCSQS